LVNILRYSQVMKETEALRETIEGNVADILNCCPWDPTGWAGIPLLDQTAVGTNYICVYDSSSGYVRCNADCTWTVPAGASKVQFQIWGAGATGGAAQCCGGAPHGQNGSFAAVIINACPGCQYVLCAGCAVCCYAQPGESGGSAGGTSYVTGAGLTNFCAMGGCSSLYCHMGALHNGSYSCCRFHGNDNPSANSGGCICATNRWWCADNSCASCGLMEYVCGKSKYYGSVTAEFGGADVLGLAGVYSRACWDTNIYGYYQAAPMIGIDHTKRTGSDCCMTWTSGECCGGCKCNASNGIYCWPGQGHHGVHTMSENTCYYGDSGRGGMVRVSWC